MAPAPRLTPRTLDKLAKSASSSSSRTRQAASKVLEWNRSAASTTSDQDDDEYAMDAPQHQDWPALCSHARAQLQSPRVADRTSTLKLLATTAAKRASLFSSPQSSLENTH